MDPLAQSRRRHRPGPFRRGVGSYAIGMAVGTLVTGLLVPFVVGEGAKEPGGTSSAEVMAAGGETASAQNPNGTSRTAVTVAPSDTGPAGTGSSAGPIDNPSSSAVGSATHETGELGASDRGVSATAVRVGFLMTDIAGAGRILGEAVAGVSPEQQAASFQTWIDEINRTGGLNGRQIEPVYRGFDVLSQDDMRAKCLALTEDEKVFAVIATAGFAGPPVLCITEEHRTPLVTSATTGTPTEYFDRSKGLLFTGFPHGNRQMANWVAELDRLGVLKDKKIGILSREGSDDLVVRNGLLPALTSFGYKLTYQAKMSEDLSTAAGQIPVEVRQMQTRGVNAVLLAANGLYAAQFVDNAGRQRWSPSWAASDFGSMYSDSTAQTFPNNFEGAVLITSAMSTSERDPDATQSPEPEPALARRCREIYEKGTGESFEGRGNEYWLAMQNCTTVELFAAGARAAGGDLTRDAFSTGMQSLGEVPMAFWGGGSFTTGKFDAADVVRPSHWFADCKCWKVIDRFRPSRF